MTLPLDPAPPRRAAARWLRSLEGKLATAVVVVLVVGLATTGVIAWTLLSRSLVAQVDAQLERVAEPLAQVAWRGLDGLPIPQVTTNSLPSDYYVQFVDPGGQRSVPWWSISSGVQRSMPQVPLYPLDEVVALAAEPLTVRSVQDNQRWRVVVRPLAGGQGSVAVALPLDQADAAVAQLRTIFVLVGSLVALLGGALGALVVRRSLRPLRRIEDTAGAIAGGDLARRVDPGVPGTEVGDLAGALNTMLAQLEAAFAAQEASEERMRRFVADASHELRTPLAAVRGYAELYRMGAVAGGADVADTMGRIEQSATRMGVLVDDLLALARLDERDGPAHVAEVDIVALARDAARDLQALDPSRAVTVVTLDGGFEVAPCPVAGDPERLRQVVTNLVGNVAAHTPAGTPCEIAVGLAAGADGAGGAVLEVRDHGPGIAPGDAGRVFERFYRADPARGRQSGGGSGLGLSIVHAIVAAHGGGVSVAETAGGGATLRVWLPVPAATD